jgi:hypothetical protein
MGIYRIKTVLFLFFATIFFNVSAQEKNKPRVFIFTDINIGGGDPDDRQSLVHLLWYADELEIAGIVPDRWNKQGLEACMMGVEAYKKDYAEFEFDQKGYPSPELVQGILAVNMEDMEKKFEEAAMASSDQNPLYVLVWGNMVNAGKMLDKHPDLINNIRLITIGTGLKYGPEDEVPGEDCDVPNWNGPGRNAIFEDARFNKMWWLEINWTYNGMFSGNGPKEMFEKLEKFGNMGNHIKFVTKDHEWAQYFRVGDTPSVLYLIDPRQNLDDPTQSSWAGKFKKPLPKERPNYFTDDNGPVEWDYANPCLTWGNLTDMYAYNKSTLEKERPSMYAMFIEKLQRIYNKD